MDAVARAVQGEGRMRLIDRDAIPWSVDGVGEIPVITKEDIEAMPTVDAVPVVRCKDCKWGRKTCGLVECSADRNAPSEYHSYDWYCPNGEKKNE